jgi:hypothetical protein
VIRKLVEIVGITYCTATNPSRGCEDDVAIPIPAEKPDHQINTDHGHDMAMG